jgi:hypothetical protein
MLSRAAGALGATPTTCFEDVLSQLGKIHSQEMEAMKKKYEAELKELRQEVLHLQNQVRSQRVSMRQNMPLALEDLDKAEQIRQKGKAEHLKEDTLADIELNVGNESGFNIIPGWLKSLKSDGGFQIDCLEKYNYTSRPKEDKSTISGVAEAASRRGCVILPSSTFRLAWDVFGLVLISYDLLTIPFNQAFRPDPNVFVKIVDWLTLLFWTADMAQGFFLGYYDQGEVVTDNLQIVKAYLKSWFVIDVVVVVPEWFVIFMPTGGGADDGSSSVGELGKFAKIARFARVLRLLRLLKMKKLLETLVDRIESEYSFILFNLVQLLCFVLVLNHVIACVWFLIGRLTKGDGQQNWIDMGNVVGDTPYLYATSLHWSLTQFTPASMDISAKNIWERLFSVATLLFAMLVFSSIVASITTSMTALRNLQGNEMRQFWLLRRYLRQRSIPKALSDRIIKFLEHRSNSLSKLVQRDRVPVLGGLSEALQDELMHEMHSPELAAHPLFLHLNVGMPAVMHRLCRLALKMQCFAEQEIVFSAGDEAKKMFFVKNGSFEYMVLATHSTISLENKEWISEAVLWTSWRHSGNLLSVTEGELLAVDPLQFMSVMSVHPKPWHFAVTYAKKFVELLNKEDIELTDIFEDKGFYTTIMATCNKEAHNVDTTTGTSSDSLKEDVHEGGNGSTSPNAVTPEPVGKDSGEETSGTEPLKAGNSQSATLPAKGWLPFCLPGFVSRAATASRG